MSTAQAPLDEVDERQRSFPPVTALAIATLILVVTGGIYMASNVNRHATLIPALVLAIAGGTVVLVNAVLLSRIRKFAWDKFFLVGRWTLFAYIVIAGMLEYVFVYDHTPGKQLALFTVMLIIFAVNVPMLLGYSVARYQLPTAQND